MEDEESQDLEDFIHPLNSLDSLGNSISLRQYSHL